MKTLLALDLGTSTGYALRGSTGLIVHGTWNLKPDRFEGGGMRFLRFQRYLTELHKASPIDMLFYEEVRRHRGTTAAHIYGGLWGHLTAWCESQVPAVPYGPATVQAIKSYATGKGNADKDAVKAAVEAWGFKVETSDEADAIALLRMKIEAGE